ncbi:hypothetical protein D3870_12180 [Noviherbaspirillum cavernae]|uniref:Uncharacterized protein n=2 Tax=Noviherbaspirillum cavernae TaxID=2320862 RepID=A0A418X2J3_9BURK|nr:hypothetical protein D3870_12180 [Noviherbaspirillum cavernae]
MLSRLAPLAAVLLALAPAAWAGQQLDTDPCAGRSQASCNALGVTDKPSIAWRNTFSASEGQQVSARLTKMMEVILQAPELREPRGMSLHPSMSASPPPAHAEKQHPALIEAFLLAKFITVEDKHATQDKKTGAWKGTGEGPMLRMRFNDLGAFLSITPMDYAKPGQYYTEPPKVGEVGGFPVYKTAGPEVILIHKRDALPWRPVPVERYLQTLISDEETLHAGFQKQMASTQGAGKAELEKANADRQTRIDTMKQQLAQLSPAQRQAGACNAARRKRGDIIGLDFNCGPGSEPLVEPNQDYFTRSAPKGSLQVLAISTTWGVLPRNDRMPNVLGRKLRASLSEMDLKALQAMMD